MPEACGNESILCPTNLCGVCHLNTLFLAKALIGDQPEKEKELREVLHSKFNTKSKGSLAAVFKDLWLRKEFALAMAHLQEYLNPVPVPGDILNRNTNYMSHMQSYHFELVDNLNFAIC